MPTKKYPNQKVTDEMVEQMILLFKQGYSYREIAKQIGGISYTAVCRALKDVPDIDTKQELTEVATQARVRRLAARRLELAEKIMLDIEAMRERIWENYEQIVPTGEGYERVLLDEPPLPDQSRAYTAIAQMNAMVTKLKEDTSNPSEGEAKNVLATLINGIKEILDTGETDAEDTTETNEQKYPYDFDNGYNIHEDPDIWGTGDDTDKERADDQ